MVCDGESFLHSRAATSKYRAQKVTVWRVPPRSPDLNPVEKFWAHLRKHLRAMDLKDAMAKRPVLGKTAYRERVRRVVKSAKKAQDRYQYYEGPQEDLSRSDSEEGCSHKGLGSCCNFVRVRPRDLVVTLENYPVPFEKI